MYYNYQVNVVNSRAEWGVSFLFIKAVSPRAAWKIAEKQGKKVLDVSLCGNVVLKPRQNKNDCPF